MDLKSGYYQVEMEPSDREKTAFVCPLGFYEYTRMPQGVTNAPATFQRLVERCVGSIDLQEVLAFLDDLIVFSPTLEDHETRLGQVFDRLHKFCLKLSPGKCSFFCKSVSYLGHIVSEDGSHTGLATPQQNAAIKVVSWILRILQETYNRIWENFFTVNGCA